MCIRDRPYTDRQKIKKGRFHHTGYYHHLNQLQIRLAFASLERWPTLLKVEFGCPVSLFYQDQTDIPGGWCWNWTLLLPKLLWSVQTPLRLSSSEVVLVHRSCTAIILWDEYNLKCSHNRHFKRWYEDREMNERTSPRAQREREREREWVLCVCVWCVSSLVV